MHQKSVRPLAYPVVLCCLSGPFTHPTSWQINRRTRQPPALNDQGHARLEQAPLKKLTRRIHFLTRNRVPLPSDALSRVDPRTTIVRTSP
ncbi:hypothetical protein ACQPXS_47065 (plasmid) [Streptomyces sp. CA-142005]|uniref:hypothetical protein n=1 Tax=Streptomyces sp. CA-142005 TaxID=3240052 RepID=UPI003D8B5F01